MNLPELIAAHRGGRTNPQIAKAGGDVFTDKRLQQLSKGQFKEFQEPQTIIALARGLRVSEAAVLLAVGESLGLKVNRPMPALLELLPASVSDLSESQVRAIAVLIYEFTDGAKQEEGNDSGTSAKKRAHVQVRHDKAGTPRPIAQEEHRQ